MGGRQWPLAALPPPPQAARLRLSDRPTPLPAAGRDEVPDGAKSAKYRKIS